MIDSGWKNCLVRHSEANFLAAYLAIDSIKSFHFISTENVAIGSVHVLHLTLELSSHPPIANSN